MFVYYLDRCLTQYWKLLFLGVGMASFVVAGTFLIKSMLARGRKNALAREDITDQRLRDATLGISRNFVAAILTFVASVGVFVWYINFFSEFECTRESIFWINRS